MADAFRSFLSRSGALLAAAAILHCGPGVQVAGGTSEVGNPSNALAVDQNVKDGDTTSTGVGIKIDFTGAPPRILKEKAPETPAPNDTASASAPAASSTPSSSPAD